MFRLPWSSAAVTAAAAVLSACGGGGGGGEAPSGNVGAAPTPAPAPSPDGGTPTGSAGGDTPTTGATPAPAPAPSAGAAPAPGPAPAYALPSAAQAARFLAQAGFGATDADIATVRAIGYAAWLDLQFLAPRSESHWDWLTRKGFNVEAQKNSQFNGLDNSVWRKLMGAPDQLRQRMTLALSDLFIVSTHGFDTAWRTMNIAAYADLLEDHAFGNFRQLLEAVTLSPAMGHYLAMRGNTKEDGRGRQPDENYAREVMQLFTVGLYQLNDDGSVKTSGGRPLETYTQADVTSLARVFTGWDLDTSAPAGADNSYLRRPMRHIASRFASSGKAALGVAISDGVDGPTALGQALDALCNHPNVGPFIGRQLIQRLVCSSPSPAYVQRVAAVWANNGAGVRGDLTAVLRAILLDSEARTPVAGPSSGKLREPVQRLAQFARSSGMTSPADSWSVGDCSNPSTRLGQQPFRAASVFSFFRPGYVPPNSAMGAAGITAPEFQLCNEVTVAGYLNFMQSVIASGIGDMKGDFTPDLALVADLRAMVARQALLLAGDGISDATQAQIAAALATIPASTDAGRLNRAKAGWLLLMATPEYQIQK